MADDSFGRQHLAAAWQDVFGDAPQLHQIQIVQAVARLESGYGRASYKNRVTGESAVINNWGASQCGHGPPCGPDCFEVTDTHADGTPYNWCYHRFATPEEGAAKFLKVLNGIVNRSSGFFQALETGSSDTFVRAMREGGYFEAKLEKYQDGVWSGIQTIATNLGEPLAAHKEEGGEPIGGGGTPKGPFSQQRSGSDCSRGAQDSSVETGSSSVKDDDNYPYGKDS